MQSHESDMDKRRPRGVADRLTLALIIFAALYFLVHVVVAL